MALPLSEPAPNDADHPTRAPEVDATGVRSGFVAGDVVRLLALVGVVTAAVDHGVVGLALMLLVLGGTMVPRAAGLPPALDVSFCAALLASAWAALLDLYARWSHLDLVAHAVVTALIALVATLLVQKWGVLASDLSSPALRTTLLVLTVSTGTALAALWEVGEWLGHTWLDPQIQVGYGDTMTDMVAGILGSALVGILVAARAPRTLHRTQERG